MDTQRSSSSESLRPLRTLLPATGPREDPQPIPKRSRISFACAACRTRKTKCDGGRPQCNECIVRRSECQYTETENAQLRRKHIDLEELFELLKSLPEQEAADLLGRIRSGAEPTDIVEQVRDGTLLMQLSLASESREECATSTQPIQNG